MLFGTVSLTIGWRTGMKFFKDKTKHFILLYAIAAIVLIFAFLSGLVLHPEEKHSVLRILCDGCSINMVLFFLAAVHYRPRGFSFLEILGFYGRYMFIRKAADEKSREKDRKILKECSGDFMDAMFLLLLFTLLTILFLLLFMALN